MNTKDALRARCWRAIREAGVHRFPGVEGRIPNFTGAEEAARRLATTAPWQQARVVKCNPDSPHRPVRRAALDAGMIVVAAVPKLADDPPFLVLDPSRIPPNRRWYASSIKGSATWGIPTAPADVPPIDLVCTGCVGVDVGGARVGKGGGYSDLEFAILVELGMIDPEVPVVTTVHDVQVLEEGAIPMDAHDISLDLFCTPTRTIHCARTHTRPSGVDPSRLSADKRAAIPVLAARTDPSG